LRAEVKGGIGEVCKEAAEENEGPAGPRTEGVGHEDAEESAQGDIAEQVLHASVEEEGGEGAVDFAIADDLGG